MDRVWTTVKKIGCDEESKRNFLDEYIVENRVDLMVLRTDHYSCKFQACKFEMMFVKISPRLMEVKTSEEHIHNMFGDVEPENNVPQYV